MPKTLAGIIAFKGMDFLPSCINSCRKSGLDILVIDNNSNDGSREYLSTLENIKLIINNKNLGFTKAANKALDIAFENKYDYLLLLNQDTEFDEEMVKKLLESFFKNEKLAIVSPVHYNMNGVLEYLFKINNQKYNIDINPNESETIEVPFVNAACWLMDLRKVEKIGRFETVFRNYASDLNYCHRISFARYKIGINAGAKLLHKKEDFDYQNSLLKTIKTYNTYYLALLINPLNVVSIKGMYISLLKNTIKSAITFKFKLFLISVVTLVYLTLRMNVILRIRKKYSINFGW